MTSSSKRNGLLGVALGLALGLVIAGGNDPATAAQVDSAKSGNANARVNTVVLANQILDRWQVVAEELGINSTAWREIFATQFSLMDSPVLRGIDSVQVDAADAQASYAQFEYAVRSAIMQSYQRSTSGKGNAKLGSTTTDQVFIPIVPCRVVDTRNVGGPINAQTARNFFFYTQGPSGDWSSQGGPAGPASTTCPGTINPNGGAPSAAVATITVVSPTAAGNFVAWSGAGAIPVTSVLNWTGPGAILANTTVIPAGTRTGTGPGGAIEDFAIYYNGPSGSAQVIVDVVGYFVETLATPLACVDSAANNATIAAGANGSASPGACPAGYSPVSPICNTNTVQALAVVGWTTSYTCFYHNFDTVSHDAVVSQRCCRVPGR